jgi:hypothetical protein
MNKSGQNEMGPVSSSAVARPRLPSGLKNERPASGVEAGPLLKLERLQDGGAHSLAANPGPLFRKHRAQLLGPLPPDGAIQPAAHLVGIGRPVAKGGGRP